jgi:two-component system, cell cycle sensor histidine kinase and response regulator CckA
MKKTRRGANIHPKDRNDAQQSVGDRDERLHALLAVSRSLSRSLDLNVVMQTITEQAALLLRIETTAIYLVNGESLYLGSTTPALPPGFPDDFRHAALADHPHIQKAITSGATVLIADASTAELTPAERAVTIARGLRTILYVPILSERERVGVLILGTVGKTSAFTPDDLDLCTALASQAALAVINANLYGSLARTVRSLEEEVRVRRQAQEELKRSEDRYRSLFDQATDGITVMTEEGGIVDFNESFARMHGYTVEEMRRFGLRDLDAPESARLIPERMQRLMAGETLHVQLRHFHKDGHLIPLDVLAKRIAISGSVFVLSFHRDLSETWKAEEERKLLEEQLQHAQRMESIGTLASGIAHDFNNILNIILGNAGMLQEDSLDHGRTTQRIAAIMKATDRGARLVKQLLTVARKSDPELRTTSVNTLLRELASLLEETLPRSISITVDLAPGLPPIRADHNQLHQVFLNLSVNARDAMPSGGTLRMTSRLVDRESVASAFPGASAQKYVTVSMRDTGTGMDAATMSRVFDPFFSTKGVGKGTGLGLAVAHGIIQRHEGFITVASEPGAGSEFTIFLPVAGDTDPLPVQAPDDGQQTASGTETILFIEDEELIREMAATAFRLCGYTVIAVPTGEEGLAAFLAHGPGISAVLSDRGLPGMSGEEVFSRLRALNPDVPFFLLTGFVEAEEKAGLLGRGIRDVIQKPYVPRDLLLTLRRVLDGRV